MPSDFRPFDPQHRRRPPGSRDPEDHPAEPPEDEAEPPPIIAGDEPECECIPIDGPRLRRCGRGKRLVKQPETPATPLSGEQRLLLLDTWRRSGLPAGDFAALVGGISKHTLYSWKWKFEEHGPEGLVDRPRGGISV